MSRMPNWRSTGTASSSGSAYRRWRTSAPISRRSGPAFRPTSMARCSLVYTTPAIYCEVRVVFTNTVPTDAYRGAGRPEDTFVLERLVDVAARDLGIDRAEVRGR